MASSRTLQPIKAGSLRHVGNIEQRVVGTDGAGSPLTAYTLWASAVPMDIADYRANETMQAQAVQSNITTYITLRFRPGMQDGMRIAHLHDDGVAPAVVDYYHIEGILYDYTRRRAMLLACVKRSNSGFRTGAIP